MSKALILAGFYYWQRSVNEFGLKRFMAASRKTYLHLRDQLEEKILQGVYKEKEKLPPERELAEQLNTTRLTLRDALAQLEAEGIIFCMDRRGWFVSGKRLTFDPTDDKGFMRNVSEQGRNPRTELILSENEVATTTLSAALKVELGARLYHLQRRRYIDDRPVLLENIYLEAERYPGLHHANLNASLSAVLEDVYGAKVKYSNIQITPVAFNDLHAKTLFVSPGTPGVLISRTSYDENDRVVEFDQEYWISDVLSIQLTTSQKF